MEKIELSAQLPDTSNLPEFFVTDIVTETDGHNVRVVAGARRGGVVHWLYSAVVPADRMMLIIAEITLAAKAVSEAADLVSMINH